jgi:hypothetical protein
MSKQTIILDDNIIEILYNENLSKNPYLIRFFNYDNQTYEMRASEQELKQLSEILKNACSQ